MRSRLPHVLYAVAAMALVLCADSFATAYMWVSTMTAGEYFWSDGANSYKSAPAALVPTPSLPVQRFPW